MTVVASTDPGLTPAQYAEAVGLQRKGATLSEISRMLDVKRDAVVDCLYTSVVNYREPRVVEIVAPKAAYAGIASGTAGRRDKVRLKSTDGRWLHLSGEGLTLVKADSWIGTPERLFRLRQLHPNLNSMTVSEP